MMLQTEVYRDQLKVLIGYPEFRAGSFALIGSFLIFVIINLLVLPVLSQHEELELDYAQARRLATESQIADQITAAYKRAKKQLPSIEKRLNKPISQSKLVDQAAKLAKRTRVTIQSQTYGNRKRADQFSELQYEVVVSGRYQNIYKFIQGFSAQPNWTTVRAMRIERTDKKREVRAVLKLVTTSRVLAENSKS